MNNLKNNRIKKGYSMQYMANTLNISKTFYWQLENNKRRLTYDMAINIANIFNMRPDQLFYDDYKIKKTSLLNESKNS